MYRNPEDKHDYDKAYRQKNKPFLNSQARQYYKENRSRLLLQKKEQYDELRKFATKDERYKSHSALLKQKYLDKGNPFYGKTHSDEVKAKRLLQIFPMKDTSIEIALQKALKERGIEFETHKTIFGQPDIFIKPNICIFADGDYWHTIPKSIPRDKLVNVTLQLMGYKVLRFWEHDIKKRLDWCICQIIQGTS